MPDSSDSGGPEGLTPHRSAPDGAAELARVTETLANERAHLREIEHRARNTLQLVSSLLALQGRRAEAPETRAALKSLHQRVGAIAAVHRGHLADGGGFDLTSFVRDQAGALAHGAPPGVAIDLDLDTVETKIGVAAPLALILNELAANALAHAAQGERPAKITISLRQDAEIYELAVQDDGPGRGESPDGLGLMLVKLMCQQLGGKLRLEDAQPGLRAVVTAG